MSPSSSDSFAPLPSSQASTATASAMNSTGHSTSDPGLVSNTTHGAVDSEPGSDSEPGAALFLSVQTENTLATEPTMFKSLYGPIKFPATNDALYWGHRSNTTKAATVRFIGLLDLFGTNSKTKPYFNMEGLHEIDNNAFKKAKAIFEIRLLPADDESFPKEARIRSNLFFRGLLGLANTFEEKRNTRVPKEQRANVTPFYRVNRDLDIFTLLVQSEPIFGPPLENEDTALTTVGLDDLDDTTDFCTSPSKMGAKKEATSGPAQPSTQPQTNIPGHLQLTDMPDPNGLYSKFVAKNPQFGEARVIAPKVYDCNQDIITPDCYGQLGYLAPVTIEAYIRLWEIPPGRGRPNGSRAYQLMLKSMQVLPYISKEPEPVPGLLWKGKGKRQGEDSDDDPSESGPGPSTPKKSRVQPNGMGKGDKDMFRMDADF